jgi:glutamine phosphoribosylpyrophosphate amidotransferase
MLLECRAWRQGCTYLTPVSMQSLQGAFSCICLVRGVGLVAFRDPNGIRPLVLGTRLTAEGPEWCVASEDCAFGPISFKRVRDVQPGEMVIITEDGELVCSQCIEKRLCPCIFEYIYLARPDSVLNNISVYALLRSYLWCLPECVQPVTRLCCLPCAAPGAHLALRLEHQACAPCGAPM